MRCLPRSCSRIVAHAEQEHKRMRSAKPAAHGKLITFTLIAYFTFAFGVVTNKGTIPPTSVQCNVGPTQITALKQVR